MNECNVACGANKPEKKREITAADAILALMLDDSLLDKSYALATREMEERRAAAAAAMDASQEETTEGLNTALYQKMFALQEAYKHDLLAKPSAAILECAYDYVKREDILLSLEYNDLEDAAAKVLLALDDPLSAVFNWYEHHPENNEGSDVDRAWFAVEECARNFLESNI